MILEIYIPVKSFLKQEKHLRNFQDNAEGYRKLTGVFDSLFILWMSLKNELKS